MSDIKKLIAVVAKFKDFENFKYLNPEKDIKHINPYYYGEEFASRVNGYEFSDVIYLESINPREKELLNTRIR